MREFVTAARQAPIALEGAEPIEFVLDGETFTAYPPTTGQLALLVASQAKNREVPDTVAAVIDFLDGILDDNAQATFRRRLMDRDDPFDFDTVNWIVENLIEEWGGRPTTSPSGSAPSRRSGGSRSTAKRSSRVIQGA